MHNKLIFFTFLYVFLNTASIMFGMHLVKVEHDKNIELINESNKPQNNTFYLHDSNDHWWFKLTTNNHWMLCDDPNESKNLNVVNARLSRINEQHSLVYENSREMNIDNLLDKENMKFIVTKYGQTKDLL